LTKHSFFLNFFHWGSAKAPPFTVIVRPHMLVVDAERKIVSALASGTPPGAEAIEALLQALLVLVQCIDHDPRSLDGVIVLQERALSMSLMAQGVAIAIQSQSVYPFGLSLRRGPDGSFGDGSSVNFGLRDEPACEYGSSQHNKLVNRLLAAFAGNSLASHMHAAGSAMQPNPPWRKIPKACFVSFWPPLMSNFLRQREPRGRHPTSRRTSIPVQRREEAQVCLLLGASTQRTWGYGFAFQPMVWRTVHRGWRATSNSGAFHEGHGVRLHYFQIGTKQKPSIRVNIEAKTIENVRQYSAFILECEAFLKTNPRA
jgi:hypothetical protein